MLITTAANLSNANIPSEGMRVVLFPDNWNDWYTYRTMFSVVITTNSGKRHELGSVKIAERGAKGQQDALYRPNIPIEGWEQLPDTFISLGQDENYYTTLKNLPDEEREQYLKGMRDCAYNLSIYESFQDEDVLGNSLLRSVTLSSLTGRYHRLANGNADLSSYRFTYHLPYGDASATEYLPLRFEVKPESKPPSNVHVMIGRNAVGKTRALNLMVRALISESTMPEVGAFKYDEQAESNILVDSETQGTSFAGLVSISFSAFDRFGAHPVLKDGLSYKYVGLKRQTDESDGNDELPLKGRAELAADFSKSAKECRVGRRAHAWKKALTTLESDPLFEEARIVDLSFQNGKKGVSDSDFFKTLSSGHGIVLLIITRLVELVEEQTIVLIDEPETHLHPPLLSAFIRAMSSHLIDRNGVAIVATHSPVVLQEVPASCVWKLTRSGDILKASRPDTETFGENVGTLTREIFGLEVVKSGFHDLLVKESRHLFSSYEGILSDFDDQLGAEARSILRALIANRNESSDSSQ